jgi:putative transposase
MNPIRAGLVADLKDYRWSSYLGKIGMRKDNLLDLDVWYESLGDTEKERQERYHE